MLNTNLLDYAKELTKDLQLLSESKGIAYKEMLGQAINNITKEDKHGSS